VAEKSFFDKLKRGLFMTHTEIIEKVKESMTPDLPIEKSAIDGLEEGLLGADIGAELTTSLIDRIEQRVRDEKITKMDRLTEVLREETRALIPKRQAATIEIAKAKPFVILVVGVNGTGKTTTIAKLAHHWKTAGEKVLLVACDTFRAGASEQLQIWADRVGVEIHRQTEGADPAAVAHDGMARAKSTGAERVIVDTAGRLHVKANLMAELDKIRRVIDRAVTGAPHETLLVLDATTGQNGLAQVREFQKALPITGLVLTKLDGTAKGGVALAIAETLKLPIRWVGVGEGMEDLIPFDAKEFAAALVGE
jgi:fused signal recognition particle receptor